MAEELNVTMTGKAFIKPLLHASKYPHCSVNGLLLATASGGSSAEADVKSSARGSLKLVDAIPLFHSSLTLAPMMEMALTQVDVYCKAKDLVIAGYYQANENLDNNKPIGVACRLADKIKETCGEATLLMIDNRKLSQVNEESYVLYTCQDGKWKISNRGIRLIDTGRVQECAASLLESRTYRALVDFDNYLDDIMQDWLNSEVDKHIKQKLGAPYIDNTAC